jgi:hypothetical protein
VPISEEMTKVLQEQRQKFIEKHGREPGPEDKIFFDMPHPEHLKHTMVEGMEEHHFQRERAESVVRCGEEGEVKG